MLSVRRPAGWHAFAALLVVLGLAQTAHAAPALGDDIVVVTAQGDARVKMQGQTRPLKPGMTVTPPATIRTGRDGAVELRQGGTRASVGADSQVEIPTVGVRGKFVERIVQPRGSVFYDVAPGSARKLRVETPYLVAVIKGTQFNVVAHEDGATVSLFEGRLEIWTPDDSDVVQLSAGEIATRGRGDRGIRVLTMATGETLRAANTAAPDESGGARAAAASDTVVRHAAPAELTSDVTALGVRSLASPIEGASGALTDVGTRTNAAETVDAKIDLGAGGLSVGSSVDTSLAGAVEASVGANAAVDPGAGSIDAGVSAGVDLGGTSLVDAGVTAGVDAGSGAVDLGVDAAVASTPVVVDAGVDLGGSPAIDVGLAAGPLDVDLGVDLGAPQTPAPPQPSVVEEVIAPLRGLFGR